ncbi:SGNH/GDSL hydrolase family protein [Desulfallas sp. Bu1-1]|uniref:SGNH/GDSL hydrolase family protein n=1 Tax=Desulfallas sp. Bu1-1 TaxID=2787620 RepID=UPI00189FEFCF|nr:SGNH/GDSL hydrolase family protein [Desulfallas sp. Bu1-1]MBF7081593.1 SGNH/GDSL hydrolase family protein [Desulfallas sp. Bu1-1]
MPIKKINQALKNLTLNYYDLCIIQIGNPDIHPRMPINILKYFRKKGLAMFRDSLFSVPPIFGIKYLLRFPFFVIRLIFIRLHQEFYATNNEIIYEFQELIRIIKRSSSELIIMPLFEVNSIIYGKIHNIRAMEINKKILDLYKNIVLNSPLLESKTYRNYYNWDWFHFRQQYHNMLSELLVQAIKAKLS